MPGRKWSFFENGMPGLHLTINPLKPLPPEVHVVRRYLDQGIVLNDRERASILRWRDEGVGTVKTILDQTLPGFAPDTRLKFAKQIVDALLDKSVSAQLSREAPSPQDQFQQETDKLNAVLRAPTPSLLQQRPRRRLRHHSLRLDFQRTAVTKPAHPRRRLGLNVNAPPQRTDVAA
jgi:hypothetical protein